MDLATGVLQANGYKVTEPDDSGMRVFTREILSLRTGALYQFRIEHVDDAAEATLVVTNRDGDRIVQTKTDTWVEIASDGVAVAHALSK